MARNEEKKQSMLNRFLAAKSEEARGPKARRPYLATECSDLNEADKWRQQILREIGKKVMEIQNAGLGEHRYDCRCHCCPARPSARHICLNSRVRTKTTVIAESISSSTAPALPQVAWNRPSYVKVLTMHMPLAL